MTDEIYTSSKGRMGRLFWCVYDFCEAPKGAWWAPWSDVFIVIMLIFLAIFSVIWEGFLRPPLFRLYEIICLPLSRLYKIIRPGKKDI